MRMVQRLTISATMQRKVVSGTGWIGIPSIFSTIWTEIPIPTVIWMPSFHWRWNGKSSKAWCLRPMGFIMPIPTITGLSKERIPIPILSITGIPTREKFRMTWWRALCGRLQDIPMPIHFGIHFNIRGNMPENIISLCLPGRKFRSGPLIIPSIILRYSTKNTGSSDSLKWTVSTDRKSIITPWEGQESRSAKCLPFLPMPHIPTWINTFWPEHCAMTVRILSETTTSLLRCGMSAYAGICIGRNLWSGGCG